MAESRVLVENFKSQVLQGNYLGDPTTRRVAVYLPPGYDESRERYPTVFMLAPFTSRGTMLLNESAWDENMQQRLDRLIRTGAILPLIMVMPDCFTMYGGSQYLNSLGTGRYEDHVIEELVPWVDEKFRTIRERYSRAVMGYSSGGFGALILAMHNPEVFSAIVSHSGDMYFDMCYRPDIIRCLRSIKKFGGVEQFIANIKDIHPRDGDFYAVLDVVGMASCYSPNLDSPNGFDLPFDEHTGEWRPEVWARWEAYDPINLVGAYADALRYMRLLYLEAGTRDEYNLHLGARTFCARLERADVPFQYAEFEDGHMNISYRYDVSLKALADVWRGEGA